MDRSGGKMGSKGKANSANTKIALNITSFVLRILLNIIFYVLVIIIAMKLSGAAYEFAYEVYGDAAVEEDPGRDVAISIGKGEGTMDLANKLEYNRIIVNKYSFFLRAKLATGKKNPILAGTYTLNTSMNYGEIIDVITDPAAGNETAEDSK